MASNAISSSVLRSMIQRELRIRPSASTTRPTFARAFSSSRSHLAAPSTPPPRSAKPLSSTEHSALTKFASQIRQQPALRSTTEPYLAYGSTEDLFRECARQCDYTIPAMIADPPQPPPRNAADEHIGEGRGWWYASRAQGGLALDVTFNTWAQVLMLHMWMLTARLRGFPATNARVWHQNLLDHFFYAAEDRMVVWHGLTSRGSRNKYLKDLWLQWRGIMLSYDEGLIKGDATLATAIWRNIFKAKEEVDMQDLALVTAYVRREMQRLDRLPDEELASGKVSFASPEGLAKEIVGFTIVRAGVN